MENKIPNGYIVDKNMVAETSIEKDGFRFYDIDSEPFRIYGVYRDGEQYRRIPHSLAESLNPGMVILSTNTAGGRVRFVTDSPRIALIATRNSQPITDNGCFLNMGAFDMYADGVYAHIFRPGNDFSIHTFESVSRPFDGDRRERLITLNMPNYGNVERLLVGIEEGSSLRAAPDHTYECPVVFYGSSITQGGCASRPGLSYQGMLSRELDMNYINLGFSGRAKGEPSMVEYIKKLEMSAFVLDYDHNAPTPEHLLATHEPLYRAVREMHPDIPIIMMARPNSFDDEDVRCRRDIVYRTYERAKADGDDNVYFLDGTELIAKAGGDGLCDGCHPNDLGFRCMADGLLPVLGKALRKC